LTVIGSLTVGIAGTFFGPKFMALLYPAAYHASNGVFVILLWALVFAGMRFIFEVALIASDDQGRYLKGMILLALLYTLATPILSVNFGIVGAAWASVLAEFSYFAYLLLTFPYVKTGDLLSHLWKPVVGSVLALLMGFLVYSVHMFIGGLMSLIGFTAFLFLAGVVSADDRQLLRILAQKEINV
jgi:O-antigen/teichoic acid export membrane protein